MEQTVHHSTVSDTPYTTAQYLTHRTPQHSIRHTVHYSTVSDTPYTTAQYLTHRTPQHSIRHTVHHSTVSDTKEESVDEIMKRVFGENWNDEERREVMKNTVLTVIQTEWHIKCRLVHPHHIP